MTTTDDAPVANEMRCSFCSKRKSEVRKLIAGPGGAVICDECVVLCVEILVEEDDRTPPKLRDVWALVNQLETQLGKLKLDVAAESARGLRNDGG